MKTLQTTLRKLHKNALERHCLGVLRCEDASANFFCWKENGLGMFKKNLKFFLIHIKIFFWIFSPLNYFLNNLKRSFKKTPKMQRKLHRSAWQVKLYTMRFLLNKFFFVFRTPFLSYKLNECWNLKRGNKNFFVKIFSL